MLQEHLEPSHLCNPFLRFLQVEAKTLNLPWPDLKTDLPNARLNTYRQYILAQTYVAFYLHGNLLCRLGSGTRNVCGELIT